jgi:predicted peptidase
MSHRLSLATWLAVTCATAAPLVRGASLSDFADFSFRSGATTLLPGRLYIPPAAVSDPATPRPLILFLHGAGESGTNNAAQVNGNIDNLLAEAKRRSAFLYAPQTNGGWGSTTILDRVKAMIDLALTTQPVDNTRLYATGLSMGGGGTWNVLNRYSDFFAAGVPICAVSPATGYAAGNLLDDAIWAFHALDDGTVSNQTSRNVINNILRTGRQPTPTYPTPPVTTDFAFVSPALDLRYTEYRTGGHGIWGRVYNTPAMYQWLFSHTTAVPEPGSILGLSLAALVISRVGRRRQRAIAAA